MKTKQARLLGIHALPSTQQISAEFRHAWKVLIIKNRTFRAYLKCIKNIGICVTFDMGFDACPALYAFGILAFLSH